MSIQEVPFAICYTAYVKLANGDADFAGGYVKDAGVDGNAGTGSSSVEKVVDKVAKGVASIAEGIAQSAGADSYSRLMGGCKTDICKMYA